MSNPYIQHQGKQTRFKPGVSGNPAGRPKGSKNVRTVVRNMLLDEDFDWSMLSTLNSEKLKIMYGTVGKAIAMRAMVDAINGDVRAAEWLRKTAYGK